MIKFNILLPVQHAKRQHKFLIPCMLPPQERDMYSKEPFTTMDLVYNAFHKPKSGEMLQIGTYHTLLSVCSKIENWRICAEDHLSYTDASFAIGNNMRLALSQVTPRNTKNTVLRMSMWSTQAVTEADLKSAVLDARGSFIKCASSLNLAIGNSFLMCCQECFTGNLHPHLIEIKEHCSETESVGEGNCNIHGKITTPWFPTKSKVDTFGKSQILSYVLCDF